MGDASQSEDKTSRAYAEHLDSIDSLSKYRSQFIIPSLADIHRPILAKSPNEPPSPECTYLCGNSLGLQPKRTPELISAFLTQWSTKGVKGHFTPHSDSPLAPFLDIDDAAAKLAAPIVGANPSEVAIMGTLTSNLHLLLSSFYEPTPTRNKILLESKAFPSDHFAISSHISSRNYSSSESMILLSSPDPNTPIIPTQHILDTITQHSSTLALILLPSIQFYSGQAFDIPLITAHAHKHNIPIGFDLAHAVGNIPLSLHDSDVDFACWCSYKYLNSGPGAIAGLFVHEKHGWVDMSKPEGEQYHPRLTGWWGDDKESRFKMTNNFVPRPGAAGWQLSNPSALDCAAVVSSLQIFNEVGMEALREKSVRLTGYLEELLDGVDESGDFEIITPRAKEERGAQLSVKLKGGLLDSVLEYLDEKGVVVDERKPDVIRVAPAPLYNNFVDCWEFARILGEALRKAKGSRDST
jgi:kynureninase